MRSILSARLTKQKEIRKQDQNGILAQNILLCGKLRLEFFRESLFRTRAKSLSSGAMVTAAKTVQDAGVRGFYCCHPEWQRSWHEGPYVGRCRRARRRECHASCSGGVPRTGTTHVGFRKVPPERVTRSGGMTWLGNPQLIHKGSTSVRLSSPLRPVWT
jgi:hypothetical protein